MEEKIFLEKGLSAVLMGCFFEIRNKYGRFHRENFYLTSLLELLKIKDIAVEKEPRIKMFSVSSGRPIAYYKPDILVESKIIVELKAKPILNYEDIRQTIEYLKTTQYEILYIVNFGENIFKPKRYIYTNDRKNFLKIEFIN